MNASLAKRITWGETNFGRISLGDRGEIRTWPDERTRQPIALASSNSPPNLSHDIAAKVPVLSLTVLVVPFSLTLEMPASREDSLEYI